MIDSASKDELLTAAECAARIGLTVRALRVYELHASHRRLLSGFRLRGRLKA